MLKEFKDFAMRGNVVDMAVGIIIGAAFGKIVSSLVSDVIMPPIGVVMGSVSFSDLALTLGESGVTLNYGLFIDTVINFLIVALAVFMLIKGINTLKRKEEEKPAEEQKLPAQEVLLTEIRDLLAKRYGERLRVIASEPVRPSPEEGRAAELAWGLACGDRGCGALAALASAPVPIYGVELRARSTHYQPAATTPPAPGAPRVDEAVTTATADPIADIDSAPAGDDTLVAWITQFDPSTPYERRQTPAQRRQKPQASS